MDRDDEQNRMQVKFLSWGQNSDLGVRSKGQISVISVTMSIFKDFDTKLLCVFTNKRYKTYQLEFSFCCGCHAAGVVGLGVLKGSKT